MGGIVGLPGDAACCCGATKGGDWIAAGGDWIAAGGDWIAAGGDCCVRYLLTVGAAEDWVAESAVDDKESMYWFIESALLAVAKGGA